MLRTWPPKLEHRGVAGVAQQHLSAVFNDDRINLEFDFVVPVIFMFGGPRKV